MDQELHDSGKRREFASGAVRDRGDLKSRPDLISPHAQMREGMIMTLGGIKYDLRNWEKGMPISECLASAQRHIEQYKRGDIDEDHLAQARWNLGAAIHYEEEIKAGRMDPAIDDMPHYATPKPDEPGLDLLPVRRLLALLPARIPDRLIHLTPQPGDHRINPATGKPEVYVRAGEDIVAREVEDVPTYYVCGPMRGLPFLNFPAFDGARDLGLSLGFNIISPADIDRENGIDPLVDPGCIQRVEEQAVRNPDLVKKIVTRDLARIINLDPKNGSGLALLPGWEDSTGGTAEIAVAHWLGLSFVDATTFEPINDPLEV